MTLVVVFGAALTFAVAGFWGWRWVRGRVGAAARAERLAVERRDRFLATVAAELDAPLRAGRIDEARRLLAELASPESARPRAPAELVDLGELVREIVEAPPFSESGPPVILRAEPARVRADRGRLMNGLRLLLWTLRREADAAAPLVITVAAPPDDDEYALIEIETQGTAAAVAALERVAGVMEGVLEAAGPAGATLALRVAQQVALGHGGRLSARAMAGQGERFVLQLPTSGF